MTGAPNASSPAPPVLVTGSSGHVGANLVRRLRDDGVRVRVLSRPGSRSEALDGLEVERARADIRDLDATRRALEGCRGVYHCAAMVSTIDGNRAHRRELFECNVLGTRNVLRAARETGAGRVVVTGSFSAVGYDLDDPSAPSDETMQFYPMVRTMPYERSKVLAEHECLRAAALGQDVVIATCCAVVGGADYLPSRLGRTLCDYANGKLHAYVDGGFAFVAARDIVAGHLLCMEHGRSGEKYIFATEYKTISDILDLYEEVTGDCAAAPENSRSGHVRLFRNGQLLPEPVSPELSRSALPPGPSGCSRCGAGPTSTRPGGNSGTGPPASARRFARPMRFTTGAMPSATPARDPLHRFPPSPGQARRRTKRQA